MYRGLTQLFAAVKQYVAALLATLEEGMHHQEVITAMQQLFDGAVELRFYEEMLRVLSLLRVRKIRGVPPSAWILQLLIHENRYVDQRSW
jgi:hypothetical protein